MNEMQSLAPPIWNVEPNRAARLASSPRTQVRGLPARFYLVCSRQSVARQSFDTLVEAIGYIQANHWAIDYTETSIEEED